MTIWISLVIAVALLAAVLIWASRRQERHAGGHSGEQGRADAIRRSPDSDGFSQGHGI